MNNIDRAIKTYNELTGMAGIQSIAVATDIAKQLGVGAQYPTSFGFFHVYEESVLLGGAVIIHPVKDSDVKSGTLAEIKYLIRKDVLEEISKGPVVAAVQAEYQEHLQDWRGLDRELLLAQIVTSVMESQRDYGDKNINRKDILRAIVTLMYLYEEYRGD